MLVNLLDALEGVQYIDCKPYVDILERKEPEPTKPAHEALLEAARSVRGISLRTSVCDAEAARRNLMWQLYYRFDDCLPEETKPELMRALLVGQMNTLKWCGDVHLSYIVRHIGFEGAAALARELGYRPVWVRRQCWAEGKERFQVITDEVIVEIDKFDPDDDPDLKITWRDATCDASPD